MRKNISVSLLLIMVTSWLQAQNLETTFALAKNYNNSGKYALAISAYRRVIFFDSAQKYSHESYKGLAESYYQSTDFSLAAYYFDLAYYSAPENVASNYFILQKSSCFLQMGDFSSALTELFSINEDYNANEEFLRVFYTAYSHFGMAKYNLAEDVALSYLRKHQADSAIVQSFKDNFTLLAKSVKKASRAGVYSKLIPGWGQLYAGDKKAALNSFLLVGSFAAAGLYTSITVGVIDAGVAFGPWFYRYYSGGYNRAEKIAVAKNVENSSLIFKGILDDWVYFYNSKVKEFYE